MLMFSVYSNTNDRIKISKQKKEHKKITENNTKNKINNKVRASFFSELQCRQEAYSFFILLNFASSKEME